MRIQGNIIDIKNRRIYYGEIEVEGQKIKAIKELEGTSDQYILPGFVDAHVHIESSMLIPSEFARLAVLHGTVATVSDPHEIANVMGIEGVKFMIENGETVPLKFNFGAPSCVPATSFESAGAVIGVDGIRELLEDDRIKYLAEMMNFPGVLFKDPEVMAKIAVAHELKKPIDGHAPGLSGKDAQNYISAGISTDHECFTIEEAQDKLDFGMKILIREGSAAKNFEALIPLLPKNADRMMFCSDDKHPDDLILGHINQLVARALEKGCDLFDVLKVACINAVEHYGLDVGQLQVGDPADFILTKDIKKFKIERTYINGEMVADQGSSNISSVDVELINNFNTSPKNEADFLVKAAAENIHIIKALNGEIITESFHAKAKTANGYAQSDLENDHLKMCVINRYRDSVPAFAFINGFGIKGGAIASCVGHDSHNIIAVGCDDESLCKAVNLIIENKGGISAVHADNQLVVPLPIAGIMTNADAYKVARDYAQIDQFVKTKMGGTLTSPFMTLSFMALLVIPNLKLSDKGLFDGNKFEFTSLFI